MLLQCSSVADILHFQLSLLHHQHYADYAIITESLLCGDVYIAQEADLLLDVTSTFENRCFRNVLNIRCRGWSKNYVTQIWQTPPPPTSSQVSQTPSPPKPRSTNLAFHFQDHTDD